MKFLVLINPIAGFSPALSEQNLQLLLNGLDYWDQIVKQRKAVGGPLAGAAGGVGIVDVESPEELHAMLQGAPSAGFVRFEVHALTTFDSAKKALRQQLENLKKMGK